MSSIKKMDETLRAKIISDPNAVLEDQDIMRALVAANEETMGSNIVDLRSIAMERLEARLDRLEDTHRNVIAAAYENLSGTNQIHRAVLRIMDAKRFDTFLNDLEGDFADILRVDAIRLVLEGAADESDAPLEQFSVLTVAEPGSVDQYITLGRDLPIREVTLRQINAGAPAIYGERADNIRSEAVMRLNMGAGRLPAMLVLGSEDPHQFTPQQGTDLLSFLTGVFERLMQRWLD